MNNAFIFDMDGVIIDTERVWSVYQEEFHNNLFGKEIAKKLKDSVGLSLPGQHQIASQYGFQMDKDIFYDKYYEMAQVTYKEAEITKDFEKLLESLQTLNIKTGLVTAAPQSWIDLMMAKTTIKIHFDYILSLHEQDTLQHKPSPDGYIVAMKYLQSTPETTIVLEDSNRGIQSAKASGALTIGFTQNLPTGYIQKGADVYADTMDDVLRIVKERFYE